MALRILSPIATVDLAPVMDAIKAADDKAANARQMVLNRDAKLEQASADAIAAKAETVTLAEIANTLGAAIPASEAVHADLASRIATLEAATTALQALKVTVGYGTAAMSGSLLAGGTTNLVVTLSRDMGSATYSVGTALVGGTGLIGSIVISGVLSQTRTTVTVQVKNSGLVTLANLAGAVVHVVAARDA